MFPLLLPGPGAPSRRHAATALPSVPLALGSPTGRRDCALAEGSRGASCLLFAAYERAAEPGRALLGAQPPAMAPGKRERGKARAAPSQLPRDAGERRDLPKRKCLLALRSPSVGAPNYHHINTYIQDLAARWPDRTGPSVKPHRPSPPALPAPAPGQLPAPGSGAPALAARGGEEAAHATAPELEQASSWSRRRAPPAQPGLGPPTFLSWQDRLLKSFVDFAGSGKSFLLSQWMTKYLRKLQKN